MQKTLNDLNKDDWNRLFPVALEKHNPHWKHLFEREKSLILKQFSPNQIIRIEHFGSTAIPTIMAKPYIDLLIEIPEKLLFHPTLIREFETLGYTHFKVPERDQIAAYSSFGKGYFPDGRPAQKFHIHLCPKDNFMWQQLQFRDYLLQHPERAKAYETLKLNLAKKHKNDRGAYVLGKTNFVMETIALCH